jgi:ATP-binding cassette subfamily B protein
MFHVMRNSSDTLSALEKVQHILAYVLIPLMLALTATGVACFLVAGIIALSPLVALCGALIFGLIYAGVIVVTAKPLRQQSREVAFALKARIQTVQEGLGGIRDVILDQSQSVFRGHFSDIEDRFRTAQSRSYFISAAPRFLVEASILVVIALVALYVDSRSGGFVEALPMLGAMAVATQRLLPLVQQMYSSWSNISANRAVVSDVVNLLNISGPTRELETRVPVPFARSIEFSNVTFHYPSSPLPALTDVNLQIRKGSRVGIAGKSGSGKSTLVDILMGLLEPTEGELKIDGIPLDRSRRVGWRRRVAHVPQSIYLSDSSIVTNIAFGRKRNQIDFDRVLEAAKRADIHDFIMSLPEQYSTRVGERGVRLSGGQRQRIGIARALYKGADLLVLDEATSALDDATERAVLESVATLSRKVTVVMIAHRLTTLRNCDLIIDIQSGTIARTGAFEAIVGSGH